MNDDRSEYTGEANDVRLDDGDTYTNAAGSRDDVESDVEQSQSLINEAKEMARRDWENQYDDAPGGSTSESDSAAMQSNDIDGDVGGTFEDAQGEVDNATTGQHSNFGGTIGDPTSDFDSEVSNKQAGLGGTIGVPNDNLGGATGDDQVTVGGDFNDARGGVGSASPRSADVSDAGLVTNDLQGAVDMNPAGDETRLEGNFENVGTTLTGGLGDEQAAGGNKFDSVRSEVERNFSDVAGTVDTGSSSAGTVNEAGAPDAGELQFSDTGVADEAGSAADNVNARAHGLGERARGAGEELKQRAAEAREQAAHRLEDVRKELGQSEGKSVVEDVQAKAKGLLNKVKDAFDSSKKS